MLETLFKNNKDEFITFINYLVDAIFVMEIIDESFYYVAINDAGMKHARLTEDAIGKRIDEVWPREEADFLNHQYQKAIEQKTSISYEHQGNFHQEGETILSPILDESGKFNCVLAVTRDITERKKVENRLRANEQRYQSVVQFNSDAVFSLDLAGNFQNMNKRGEEISGYKVWELLNTSFVEIISPKDLDKALIHFTKAKTGKAQDYEIRIKHKEGHYVDCLVKNIPMVVDNEVVGVFGIAKDITKGKKVNQSIRESEERYSRLVDQSPDPIFIHLDGFIEYVNEAAIKLLEASGREQVIGKSIYDFSPISFKESVKARNEKLLNGEITVANAEEEIVTINGKSVHVEVSVILTGYKGKLAMHSIVRDISKRKKLENKLIESEERYRIIADNSTDLIELLDINGKIVYSSPSHKKVVGQSAENLLNKKLEQFIHSEDRSVFLESLLKATRRHKVSSLEVRLYHIEERFVWLRCEMIPIFDEESNFEKILFVGEDITERKKYEEKIYHMAFHDSLTGLPNRRLFNDRLKQALSLAKRNQTQLAIIYLDCDNFKLINDELGHDTGDEFLQSFAKKVKSCIRESDTFARIGGDEFNILLPDIQNEQELVAVAERILAHTKKPWQYQGQAFHVTASIGISIYPEDAEDRDTLITKADNALYKAKASGKNTFCINLQEK